MIRLITLALCAVALIACSKKEGGDVTVTGDRPGTGGCLDCLTLIAPNGAVKLDTAKIQSSGAMLTAVQLDLSAGGGQSVTLPVAGDGLGKPDLAVVDKLDGMPTAADCKAWGSASANLKVKYETTSGAKGDVTMQVPVKVQDCP